MASDYFMQVKHLNDDLALVRQPLTYDDIITYILVVLGHEYYSLVTTVSTHDIRRGLPIVVHL